MKKVLLVALALTLMIGVIYAEFMNPGPQKGTMPDPKVKVAQQTRTVPDYNFSVAPTALMTSYWDYMIGSYNHLPIRAIPSEFGGGYFLTYMGQRQPTSQRRVFYAYISPTGEIVSNNEITNIVNREGFPTLAVDPISGKPFYAWHANADADVDLEVQYTTDAFLDGIAGLFNDVGIAIDNPTQITPPGGVMTSDNVFIWPTAIIGPSPVAGMRRVYVEAPNSVNHSTAPVGNTYIAYADFNGEMIELGTPFTWSFTSIPELDTWDSDTVEWRRAFCSLTADNSGNIYYVGTHFAQDAASTTIDEPDMDIWICDNYGAGTWRRVSAYSNLPSWNPNDYFTKDDGTPFTDEEMYWGISNSGHLNAIVSEDNKIHAPALWALQNTDGTYWPVFQVVKEFVFDIANETFEIREIFPISANPDDYYQSWDIVAPWGDVDEVDGDGYPVFHTYWPFPYWDSTAADNSMMFHYNQLKISEANDHGMMVAVWQDCARAREYNQNQDPEYTAFANTPEIYISVSPDNGNKWSEPISLNNVETTAFAGIKPMWPYPADKVQFVGMSGNQEIGKIAIMFYDDNTWGSFSQSPPVHPTNDGGRVMFMELEIVFPPSENNNDNVVTPMPNMLAQNYPNPFNPETTISFSLPMAGQTNLAIYNVKGQLVKSLVNSSMNQGPHKLVWNGTDNSGNSVTSGIYFYKLSHNGRTETRKMMLMK